jgi:CRP-like cAMP-binding protein
LRSRRHPIPPNSNHLPTKPQGDVGATEFYVLETGAAEALLLRSGDPKPRRVAAYGPGGSFGELALLYSAPRAATVRTTAPCALWVAERAAVMRIKRQFAERQAQAKLELLERVPMFGCLTDQHKQLLAGAMEQVCGRGDVGVCGWVREGEGGRRSAPLALLSKRG